MAKDIRPASQHPASRETLAALAPAVALIGWREIEPDVFVPATLGDATHVWDVSGDVLTLMPIADANNPARISRYGDTYLTYGF